MRGSPTKGAGVWLAAALALVCAAGAAAQQEPLSARAVVDKQEVMAGEPFLLEIRVKGSESPEKPDLSGLEGFDVVPLGGSSNSSQSVTIINGRLTRIVEHGFVWNYRLTAREPGVYTIPAIEIRADGRTARTRPIQIRVSPPEETEDFKLRVTLSAHKAYVGQALEMTVKWYVGRNVRNFVWTVPVLDDDRFEFADPRIQLDPNRHIRIPIGSGEAIAERDRETLDGREFVTVTLRKYVIPREPGRYRFPQATVAGQTLRGFRRPRSLLDELFDDDFFGFGRQAVFENFVVPSNRPELEVLPLPEAGRPPNFSGLVGTFRIRASASPTEVNVGDPITLTLEVSGPPYLGNVDLPPLAGQPALARDFKIPSERADGVVEGGVKKFTQTLRAMHPGVKQIPPVELAYFNPRSGRYEIARTDPIPITVRATRIVTASDVEGLGAAPAAQAEVQSAEEGIAFNYEGPDVLVNQAFGPRAWLMRPVWAAALGLPPLVYFALFGIQLYRRRRDAGAGSRQARQSFKRLARRLREIRPENTDGFYAAVLEAMRGYLAGRFGLPRGALTFADLRPVLEARGAGEELISEWKRLFDRCEAGRYAGAAFGDENPEDLLRSLEAAAKRLEEALR